MDAKFKFFNFQDNVKCYTSNLVYFERPIHWCTQNHLWTSSLGQGTSSMHQEGYIRNIPDLLLFDIYVSIVCFFLN